MFDRIPPFVRGLLIVNAIVFVLQLVLGADALVPFMLWPWGEFPVGEQGGERTTVGFLPWQLVTYGFVHVDGLHLLFNALGLMFGSQLEQLWGTKRFAGYFFACMIGVGLLQLGAATAVVQDGGELYPVFGATGAVFGLLIGFAMMFPHHRVLLLIPPVPMKARTLVAVLAAVQLLVAILSTTSRTAALANLFGMAIGFVLVQHAEKRWPFGGER